MATDLEEVVVDTNGKVVELDDGKTSNGELSQEISNSPKVKVKVADEQDCDAGIVKVEKVENGGVVVVDTGEAAKANGDIPDPAVQIDPTQSLQPELSNDDKPATFEEGERDDPVQVVEEKTPTEEEEKIAAQVQLGKQEEKMLNQEEEEKPIEEETKSDAEVEVGNQEEETPFEEEKHDSEVEAVKDVEETPTQEEEKIDAPVEVLNQHEAEEKEEIPFEEEKERDAEVKVVIPEEETPSGEEEKRDVQVEVVKQEEKTRCDDVNEEGLKCEINNDRVEEFNGTVEDQDKFDRNIVVEEIREPIIEDAETVKPELNLPDDDEKDQEETKTEVVESDSTELAHAEEKVEDQGKIDCDSESRESPELVSQIDVTDHLESEEDKIDGVSQLASSEEEAGENHKFHLPVVEPAEFESLQVTTEEDVAEQSPLQPSEEVGHNTLIKATEAVETEPSQPSDKKECRTTELVDETPVNEPSTQLELENLNSGSGNAQVETEAINGTEEVGGSMTACSVEETVSESELVNGTSEAQKTNSASPIAQVESEPPLANGHVENAELLANGHVSVSEMKPETDVENVSAANVEDSSAVSVACEDKETEAVQVPTETDESISTYSIDDAKAKAALCNGSIQENKSILAIPDLHLERETAATNGSPGTADVPTDNLDDTHPDCDGGNSNPASKEKLSTTVTRNSESLVSNGPVMNGETESKSDWVNDVESVENEGDKSLCGDHSGKLIHEGNSVEGGVGCNGSLSPSPEDSAVVEIRPFRFLIRVPRYIDDKIKVQTELAQKQVEQRTRDRDDIRSTIQSRRATSEELREKFEAAKSEERVARDAMHAKRREMDSVQTKINRMKNVTSIEDIEYRIRNMEHRMEHETVPLKEEKQLMREIKQLKQLREQLSSSLSQQDELQPASDDGVEVEERFKLLKREIDSCKKDVQRLEGITQAARKIFIEENEKIRDLQTKFRAADDRRQEAYLQLQNLKKQLYEKNKYFRMYKDDSRKAEDYAIARDKDSLQHLCVNQVETLMELWNNNDEFRKEYIRCNTNSTIRRLRTLDGRSLGPDEEPPMLHTGQVDRSPLPVVANKVDFPSLPTPERAKPVVMEKKKAEPVINLEQKQTSKSKKVIEPTPVESSSSTVTVKPEINEDSKKKLEEIAIAKKEEELKKAEEVAKLKELRRLEEKAKAKEAEERKKRNAEKAQARAQLKAQKEAELKEKEREKKARKKERKKEKVEAATEPEPEKAEPEVIQEAEIKEKPKTISKRSLKPSLLTKPKVVPPPLPLRNRSKKRMQHWMWILLVVVVAIALFFMGSFKFGFGV